MRAAAAAAVIPEAGLEERLGALDALADALEERRAELATAAARDFHRLPALAAADVELAVRRLRAFPEVTPLIEGRGPLGTVAVVLPGNAALSNPVATLGNAFLGGNRVLARFPSSSARWARRIEPLLAARLPGVSFDRRPGREFLAAVLADPEVAAVMVFGDDAWVGAYEQAVRRSGKKLIFEGPGNDPFLVLPGADLERAARDAVRGAFYDAGQACTSPERFYVHEELAEPFLERVVALTREQVTGDAAAPGTTVGPIVNRRVAERIAAQLAEARSAGARFLAGGGIEEVELASGARGFLVEPTVVTDLDPRLALLREETFGPVIPVVRVAGTEEALELAAATPYGLAASLYGGPDEAWRVLAESHGNVFRDEIWIDYFRRHLHAPYGGRKRSGWVWETRGGRFTRREGTRVNALELTRGSRPPTPREIAERLCATTMAYRFR